LRQKRLQGNRGGRSPVVSNYERQWGVQDRLIPDDPIGRWRSATPGGANIDRMRQWAPQEHRFSSDDQSIRRVSSPFYGERTPTIWTENRGDGSADLDRLRQEKTRDSSKPEEPWDRWGGPSKDPPRDNNRDQASPSETINLQYELFRDAVDDVLKNIDSSITLINDMQKQFGTIRANFGAIQQETDASTWRPLPYDLLAYEPPQSTVIEKWGELAGILNNYLQTAHQ